jgi:16S rRNA (guanine527-N7)-methyltransferase
MNKIFEGAGLTSAQFEQLHDFAKHVISINETINITGAKSVDDFLEHHVFDSVLALQQYSNHYSSDDSVGDVYDVGSGNGLPGIVLSILQPNWRVVLVERREKKASALEAIVNSLRLEERVSVECASFEQIKRGEQGSRDTVWMRGVLPGDKLINYLSQSFVARDFGQLVLMKGPAWPQERNSALALRQISGDWRCAFESSEDIEYSHERLGQRHLVVITPA